MFGYITVDMTALTKQEREQYKSCYCGLCHALAKRYGAKARMLLTFDFTFLFIMLSSDSDSVCQNSMRCPYKPGKKRICISGNQADYCADMTVLLSYLKFEDDIADDNSKKAKLMRRTFRSAYNKAKNAHPELETKIRAYLKELSLAEQRDELDAFVPADIFGRLLSEIFSQDINLKTLGYHLGRFIYLCDAMCDFKSDIKKGRYNPLIAYRTADFYPMLKAEALCCTEQLEGLDIKRFRSVIDNVFERGIWLKYNLKRIK